MNEKNEVTAKDIVPAAKTDSETLPLRDEKMSENVELSRQVIFESIPSSGHHHSSEILSFRKYQLIESYYSTANSLRTTNPLLAIRYYEKALDYYGKYLPCDNLYLNDFLNIAMLHYNLYYLYQKNSNLDDSLTAKLHFCKAVSHCESLNKILLYPQMGFDFYFCIKFELFYSMLTAKKVAMIESGEIKTAITQIEDSPLQLSLYKFPHASFVLNKIKNCNNNDAMTIFCEQIQTLFEIKEWLRKEKTLKILLSRPPNIEELQNHLIIRDKSTITSLKEWEIIHRNIIMHLKNKNWNTLVDSISSFITTAKNTLEEEKCGELFDIYVYKTIRCVSAGDKLELMKVVVNSRLQIHREIPNQAERVKRVRFDENNPRSISPNSETIIETNNNNTSTNITATPKIKTHKSSAFFSPINKKKLRSQDKNTKTISEENNVKLIS